MKKTTDQKIFSAIAYTFTFIGALICFIPFWLIIIGSVTSEAEITTSGYSFWPKEFSLQAYSMAFQIPERIVRAYGVSILITVFGGLLSIFVTAMSAFVLMRKDFRYRNKIALFFYFPTIFSGGMIPSYILIVMYLGMKNTIWALILPGLLGAWNIFLMRNFMRDIPYAIMESAKIDGANDFNIFVRLYLPLSGAGLATIGLFVCLGYWNNWYNAMMYIDRSNLYPLQYLLYQMLTSITGLQEAANAAGLVLPEMPNETFKMAMAVITTGPIIFLYPFVQKYFVKGLTVGAVKG